MMPAGGVLAIGLTRTGVSDQFALPGPGPHAYVLSSVVSAVAGTSPSLTVALQVMDVAGTWRTVATLSAQTAAGGLSAVVTPAQVAASLGVNAASLLVNQARFSWTITGTNPVISTVLAATTH